MATQSRAMATQSQATATHNGEHQDLTGCSDHAHAHSLKSFNLSKGLRVRDLEYVRKLWVISQLKATKPLIN